MTGVQTCALPICVFVCVCVCVCVCEPKSPPRALLENCDVNLFFHEKVLQIKSIRYLLSPSSVQSVFLCFSISSFVFSSQNVSPSFGSTLTCSVMRKLCVFKFFLSVAGNWYKKDFKKSFLSCEHMRNV